MRHTCPVCGTAENSLIWQQSYALFEDSSLPRSTAISACAHCGVVYARSDAQVDDYRQHYARHSKYDTAQQASGSGELPADRARMEKLMQWLGQHVQPTAAILDIGAGRGGLLNAFKAQGYDDVTGIDPSAGCVATMHAHGLAAFQGDLEMPQWASDPRRFDLIILSHVLEHVFDVRAALMHVISRLTDRGAVYVEVPDPARYTVDGYPPFYFFDPEHINHLDAAGLQQLAWACGMSVQQGWQRSLDVGAAEPYPAVGALLTRMPQPEQPRKAETASRMEHYARLSQQRVAEIPSLAQLENLVRRQTPLLLWGAGSHAQRLLANSSLSSANLIGVIDTDTGKQGRLLNGIPVLAPEPGLALAQQCGATIGVAVAINGQGLVDSLRQRILDLDIIAL